MSRIPALAAALFTALPSAVVGQTEPSSDQATLTKRRAEKLAKPVFKQANWQSGFASAQTTAALENKFLLVYFTRSFAP